MADVLAEHRIQMPAPAARAGMSTAPEKLLNRFVHLVALVERFGNALGTLAFTWATVVLLGGYPAELRRKDDFWFTITIVFLEAARYVFSFFDEAIIRWRPLQLYSLDYK
ncbi:uncharacterized protein [Triticum aestivum]|uniref:uncharacterized protein n=1 Tax=Triticum aestivum TaxID=4565 RepID=UPI001D00C5FB|nr:uncharacterized protein LOC123055681 [Triticum aestivum]XP_045088886.1 uncharacterized protein LOC123497065 [Aegilops tauschii subsp. strangulata]